MTVGNAWTGESAASACAPDRLSGKQRGAAIAMGLTFWLGGALTVKYGAPMGLFGPTASAAAFAAAFPIAWVGVLVIIRLAKLRPGQYVGGVVVGTCAATLCDGLALTWARGLYGSDPDQVVYGAAWILWGAAAFLLAAIFEARRRGVQPV